MFPASDDAFLCRTMKLKVTHEISLFRIVLPGDIQIRARSSKSEEISIVYLLCGFTVISPTHRFAFQSPSCVESYLLICHS